MEKELTKFYKNLTENEINNELVDYKDEKGNYTLIGKGHLICAVTYLELTEDQKKIFIFEGKLDKDLKLNVINTITQKDEEILRVETAKRQGKKVELDKTKLGKKIVDVNIEVSQAWQVENSLKMTKIFAKAEEALKFTKDINSKYLKETK